MNDLLTCHAQMWVPKSQLEISQYLLLECRRLIAFGLDICIAISLMGRQTNSSGESGLVYKHAELIALGTWLR